MKHSTLYNKPKAMLSSVFVVSWLILGLVSCSISATIRSDPTNVGIDVALLRGYTRQQYTRSVIDFWTPERMASAIPAELTITGMHPTPVSNNNQQSGVERVLTPSASTNDIRAYRPTAAGRAFFMFGDKTYVCSGSVVNAKNRDTIVTAGHCVVNTTNKAYADKWMFVPHYHSGDRPVGTFVARYLAVKKQYLDKADMSFDVAIVTVDVNEQNEHVQDVVGAFGISLNAPVQAGIHAFGFPMNMNNGETLSNCITTSKKASIFLMSSYVGITIKCGMGGGASGGPWLQKYDTNTRLGQQVSVTSFSHTLSPGNIHGPHFNDANIGSLFLENQNN
ncbi:unnamed protein product [Rotaria sp. Silwood2]|nr:unnamed protein product [Rotaria sp. Silwood2]CAF4435818.1 unnamed protein product [Rotaria sp. Silwood2]